MTGKRGTVCEQVSKVTFITKPKAAKTKPKAAKTKPKAAKTKLKAAVA